MKQKNRRENRLEKMKKKEHKRGQIREEDVR